MSLYDQLNPKADPGRMLQQLRQNPAAALQSAGLNIPAGMTNPQQIVQHLLQSGQIPQSRFTQAMSMLMRR